ncbi:TIGR04255 family protein [Methylobacter sp. sgz302048]|uniref:TIGR04255 family protein n=1 Tax=Methylobacter sp. sgz302048 TaxID=3455945 RepID=UPI003F9EC5AA
MQTSKLGKLSCFPINDAHAIVEVIIFVQFSPQFSKSTIQKLAAIEHDLKEDLPKANPLKKIAFQFNQAEHSSAVGLDELAGIELQRIKKDGSIEWMLRTTEDAIAIHCLDYTRWDNVWSQAEAYLQKAFMHIDGSNSFVSSIGLKYIDRFLYDSHAEKYDLSELFDRNTPHIVKTAFDHNLWHCHSGWFEDLDNLQCLNQLNIDSNYINIKGEKTLAISIDHNAIAIMNNDNNLYSIIEQNSNQVTKLNEIIYKLHLKNKEILTNLLSKEMLNRINLKFLSEDNNAY